MRSRFRSHRHSSVRRSIGKSTLATLSLVSMLAAVGIGAPLFFFQNPSPATNVNVNAPLTSANPIAASRLPVADTWPTAGATIATRTTQCGATVTLGATAATNTTNINTAISACTSGQFVQLPAGTYNYNGILFDGKNNVTLRAAGPGTGGTMLVLVNDYSCRGYGSYVCIVNNDSSVDYVPDNPVNVASWTAGYSKGTTSITLSANTLGSVPPNVGTLLHLDQLDDSVDQWPAVWNCQGRTSPLLCSFEGGDAGRTGRGQTETVAITNVTGTGPYTVTISPGLQMPNWRSGQTPQAHWSSTDAITGVGIEDIAFDISGQTGCVTSPADNRGLVFFNATNSWVKNIRTYKACRDHVLLFQSTHITVRDSYFYEGHAHASQSYGVETFVGSNNKIENNIFQRVAVPLMHHGGMGNVSLYNYQVDDGYDVDTTMQAGWQTHSSSAHFNYAEGNDLLGWKGDAVHGAGHFNTAFRNFFQGWYTGQTTSTNPVYIYTHARYWNAVGNVVGTDAYHSTYDANSSVAIWSLGDDYGDVPADTHVAESFFRWGNYDTVNDAVRWEPSEVPTGLTNYAQTVPSSQTLPSSLVYSAQPSWWSSPCGATPAWPPHGPDVTGGNISNVGGHANKIPARMRYEGGAKDGNGFLTNYDAGTCN